MHLCAFVGFVAISNGSMHGHGLSKVEVQKCLDI